ncbi:MAG: HEAT repeat domain-containing protein [Planctomycetes bacterium]|nr:HEAT repeat domain-containing protein [Planctomycetota bacterium]
MKKTTVRLLCAGVLFLPLLFAEAQEQKAKKETPREEAQSIFKGIQAKLHGHKPAGEILESLKALDVIQEEFRKTRNQVEALLSNADPAVRRHAAKTLAEISRTPDHAPTVVKMLVNRLGRETNDDSRAGVLVALARMGSFARPHLPVFVEALKDPDPRVRRAGTALFFNLNDSDAELIPMAISALDDPDLGPDEKTGLSSVSMRAMIFLQMRGSRAKKAAPALIRIAKSGTGSENYRFRSLATLATVAPEDRLPLNTAKVWLKETHSIEKLTKATGLLSELGPYGKDAVPELISLATGSFFKDPVLELRLKRQIVDTFARIGPAAKDALPTLQAMSATENTILRSHVFEAIKAVQPKD